jgi:hypothetical protein
MRFHAIGTARDTTWVATVSAGIQKNLGVEVYVVSRQKSARDELLSALSTLELKK